MEISVNLNAGKNREENKNDWKRDFGYESVLQQRDDGKSANAGSSAVSCCQAQRPHGNTK
ncbi:Protein of unknown function, partial [Gryllus bimaculatus]